MEEHSKHWPPPSGWLDACTALHLPMDANVVKVFAHYLQLLLDANQHLNLTAVRDPDQAWFRHIFDSLSLLPHISVAHRVLDVGAGGGLPGMVLAIARPELDIFLLESSAKKCRFLERSAAELALSNVHVICDRAEIAAHKEDLREAFDLVVSRAFAPLPVLLECAVPFAAMGGRILAMKGKRAKEELHTAVNAMIQLHVTQTTLIPALPHSDRDAVIIEFIKREATPSAYPRRPGMPSKRPL